MLTSDIQTLGKKAERTLNYQESRLPKLKQKRMITNHVSDKLPYRERGNKIMHGYQDENREYKESDWKLFRKRITEWQENYINKLNKEYNMILLQERNPSENFWELEKRINHDKRKTGVMAVMRKSKLIENILDLLHEGAIMLGNLDDFSDDLKDTVQLYVQHSPEIHNIQKH